MVDKIQEELDDLRKDLHKICIMVKYRDFVYAKNVANEEDTRTIDFGQNFLVGVPYEVNGENLVIGSYYGSPRSPLLLRIPEGYYKNKISIPKNRIVGIERLFTLDEAIKSLRDFSKTA